MTATVTKAPASTYVSGWCHSGNHDRCLGAYAGVPCTCPHHSAPPPPPDPEPPPPAVAVHHCPTCTCQEPT